jgi:hypothetical protein
LVTGAIRAGQRLLGQLAGEGIPVRVACLLRRRDRLKPTLHIATPLVDQKGPIQAYREVLDVLHSFGDDWRDLLDISLVGEQHPLVRDIQALPRRGGGFLSPDFSALGGMAVDEVYIYPPSEVFPGFNQIKQKFPSAEVFTIDLPDGPALPANWGFHPTVTGRVAKVNSQEFEGKAPETLYFVGPRDSREENVKQLVFAYRPEGWNTMYDPKAKQWQRVVFEKANRPLFEPADFSPLLELKGDPISTGSP